MMRSHVRPANIAFRMNAPCRNGRTRRTKVARSFANGQERSVADYLTQAGFPAVDVRVFKVDHRLGDDELAALVAWWLGKP